MAGLTISYEKWVYSLILTPHHSLHSCRLHHITHPGLAAMPCLEWNMNLLLFPLASSQAKSSHPSLASGRVSGAKAAQRPRPEGAQLPGLWVWQGKASLFRRLSLPLQELTDFEVNLFNCFLLDLGEVWKLSASTEVNECTWGRDEDVGCYRVGSWWWTLNGPLGWGRPGHPLGWSTTESFSYSSAVCLTT